MHPYIKSGLSKINFALGRNPVVEKTDDFRKYIPAPYKAVFTLSADFELAWAWRFSRIHDNPLQIALQKARTARKNVPEILQICEDYNIPITWATVGHLFLEQCEKENGHPHPDIKRQPYFKNEYWNFKEGDWFKDDPCTDFHTNPEWYCPDLLDMIQGSSTRHEIGCHTFSHIDCRDEVCPTDVFTSEILKCQQLAKERNILLKTLIFPAHTVGNLDALARLGFTNYRTNINNILGYPVLHQNGLWELKSTYHLDLRNEWTNSYQIDRFQKIIDRAIRHQSHCHFWFHPSFSTEFLREVIPAVFAFLHRRRDEIFITTTGQYVDWLNKTISTEELLEDEKMSVKNF